MSYLGIDIDSAAVLASALRRSAAQVDPVQDLVMQGEQLGEIHVPVTLQLDQIDSDFRLLAVVIEQAVHRLTQHRLASGVVPSIPQVPETSTGQVQWNAEPELRWNQVRQESSHNTYGVHGGIAALYDAGVRSFELDIHRGAPTDLSLPGSWVSSIPTLVAIVADHFDHAGGRPDDWRVYHSTGDEDSEYEYLSDGLAAVAALPSADPITVFIDVKDDFGGTHTRTQLSQVVHDALGDRLFTPAAMLDRSPGATSLPQVVTNHGWPTVTELQGKVMIVLTGDAVSEAGDGQANYFVAERPTFSSIDDQTIHVPHESTVFYNVNSRGTSQAELRAMQLTNSVVRTYFNRRCGATSLANYRAVDIGPEDEPCDLAG